MVCTAVFILSYVFSLFLHAPRTACHMGLCADIPLASVLLLVEPKRRSLVFSPLLS